MARKDASIQRVTYNRGEKVTGALMSLPAIILLIAFLIIPIVYTIFYSLFQYQVVRPDSMEFIGLENYLEVFQTEEFYVALRNTFYFTVLVVPIQCVLALCLALLVRSLRRGVSIFRTMYFAPQVDLRRKPGQLPGRPRRRDERHHLHVRLAGRRLPDDDLPRRPAGHPGGTV